MSPRELKNTLGALLMLLAGACASGSSTESKKREPQMSELENKIKTIQTTSSMPGLQVLVTEGEKTVFEYTNGIRAEGRPETVTSNDQWHIGSCTKPMTAFLIGRLVDAKIITWQTTLSEIAPKNYQLDPSVRGITVEQLLSHKSGLAVITDPENGKIWGESYTDKMTPQVAREKLVKSALKIPVRFQPGSKFEYSNTGYIVLGWIVEQKRGESWEQVIQKELFQRFAMNSCGFGPAGSEDLKSAKQPWSHILENNRLVALPPGLQADNPPALGPAGTVHCGVRDWHKFSKLFIDNEGVRSGFLTQATYDKLLSNDGNEMTTFSSMGRYDRPWAKGPAFAMAGSNTYNFAIVAIAPNRRRIYTINTNAGHEKADQAAAQILKLVADLE
ncbi:serine hydrolase domain-containing protein [Bdellovibrio sp. HCB337]|uniref:serine hydrolase domain-containing protein n=1 Tax=Bdellovibrio sp. HCB337 TaxID=3394358 RepID=UPI0039A70E17